MPININTIITNFNTLYPANIDEIWRILKEDNSSLTEEIIEQLDIEFTEQAITITVKSTSTDYTGSVLINSYQYNLYVQIDGNPYYVYDFNQFCSDTGSFNVTTNVGDRTFTTSSEFTSLEFIGNPSINFINNYFLVGCTSFNLPLTIPNGVISIGNSFLANCQAFNQPLIIPNSVTTIGINFMGNCQAFNQSLTLPNSLTSTGNAFLYNCKNFNQPLTLPNSLTSIGNNFLHNCITFNQPLTIPNSATRIGVNFMGNCIAFNQPLTLSNSLIAIGHNFLASGSTTTPMQFNQSLIIPNSVTTIDYGFLNNCISFQQPLTLSNSLVSISHDFMYNCRYFNQPLTLPNSLTSIGNNFLYNCERFNKDLKLTDNITNIGQNFMCRCDNFDSVLRISPNISPSMFSNEGDSFATENSSATVYTNGFKIRYDKFEELKTRFPDISSNYYRHLVDVSTQTTFIAKETSLSYKYHLNFVLGENDIKVYLVKENEVTMKFDKPITTILPDTSTGKLLIGNALKNLPKDQLTETAIETKITAINFYNK